MSKKLAADAGAVLEYARDRFNYDPLSGQFTRKDTGVLAGHANNGYIIIKIGIHNVRAHRLAWLWCYGEWPSKIIDHINRVRTDNRIANLRDVDHSTNARNSDKIGKNTSGYRGVCWNKRAAKWQAYTRIGGKLCHIGYFDDILQAAAAYQLALATLENSK